MNNRSILPSSDSFHHLQNINNIRFTRREIDIIACIFGAMQEQPIASLLGIARRTVEAHIYNIRNRLGCNSRDGIRVFIEQSGRADSFTDHYRNFLLATEYFVQSLRDIHQLIRYRPLICQIFDRLDLSPQRHFSCRIARHLNRVGIRTINTRRNSELTPSQTREHFLCIISEDSLETSNSENIFDEVSQIIQEACSTCVFLGNQENIPQELQTISHLCAEPEGNYHLFFYNLLAAIFPDISFDSFISEYTRRFIPVSISVPNSKRPDEDKKQKFVKTFICLFIIIILYLMSQIIPPPSNVVIPHESTLLNRGKLITTMKENFSGEQGVQVVILSGIGGAGKTTLARVYADKQKNSNLIWKILAQLHVIKQPNSNLTWEINAETRESLINAFENLAYALSKEDGDRKELREIEEVRNSKEREKLLILFIKRKLKECQNWLLIYDNVEKLSDIQEYFPHNSGIWGAGKVIVTTRDSTITNKAFKVINVEELSNEEKFNLFTKILHLEDVIKHDKAKQREINTFLEKIPPFPLDVSAAACYLESENISCQDYLDRIENNKPEFNGIIKSIINKLTGYEKNRYEIIVLSIEKIISKHKDFKDLLLLISLIDSQNIPRDLLDRCKRKEVVDSFLYNLKKNSFIVNESSPFSQTGSTFSLHRSIQEIFRHYFIEKLNTPEYRKLFSITISILEKYVGNELQGNDLKHFNFIRLNLVAKHGESLLVNKNLEKNINKENLLAKAHLLRNLGIIYRQLGIYKKAKDLLEESCLIFKEHLGQESIEMAKSLGNLAVTLGFFRNYQKAQEYYKQARSVYYKNYDKDSVDIGWLLIHFGNTNRELGQFEDARSLYEEGYRIFLKNDGKNHYHVAWCLGNLGEVYRQLGYYEKARDTLEESLRIYKDYHANNILRHAWVSIRLGKTYISLGIYERAKDLLEKSLSIYHDKYGGDNIKNIEILVPLAKIYIQQGSYESARKLLEKSIEAYKNYYGENHVETALANQGMADFHFRQGNLPLAEEYFKKALDVFQKGKYFETYICLENLAELYLEKAKQIKEQSTTEYVDYKSYAINYLKQTLETLKIHFPKDSPHIQRIESKMNELNRTKLS